ncbi:MAG: aminotransferase DegT [Euryarchaeota archaeon]|nr:aminotransferase DegT [Euryarchaeota archaeon]|tara:strand:+ start:1779 stop:2942 length:1164 start_codon:yes stop_codon:yes gene_type:complete
MKIPIAKTKLTEEEFNNIQKPLKSGWLVQGKYVKKFEQQFSTFTGIKHSIAVTSCTSALHLSLSALGFKFNDEAIVPAFTWISSANVVEHLGGKVVFCDIDLKTFNIDVNKIESLITPKTKVIIPVHLFGLPSNMDEIMILAKKYKLWVVEDAACGFGAKFKSRHVGAFGNAGCFSFHPRKIITTGEGGMITTNDSDLAIKLRSMRDHGAEVTDYDRHTSPKPYLLPDFPYAGYNYRMTDIQAALGSTQMSRANQIINERKELASEFNKRMLEFSHFQVPFTDREYDHGFQSYPCLFNFKKISMQALPKINKHRNQLMQNLESLGISTRPATHAVHMLKYYKNKYKIKPVDFPNSYIANQVSISLPLYNGMTIDELDYIIKGIRKHL